MFFVSIYATLWHLCVHTCSYIYIQFWHAYSQRISCAFLSTHAGPVWVFLIKIFSCCACRKAVVQNPIRKSSHPISFFSITILVICLLNPLTLMLKFPFFSQIVQKKVTTSRCVFIEINSSSIFLQSIYWLVTTCSVSQKSTCDWSSLYFLHNMHIPVPFWYKSCSGSSVRYHQKMNFLGCLF